MLFLPAYRRELRLRNGRLSVVCPADLDAYEWSEIEQAARWNALAFHPSRASDESADASRWNAGAFYLAWLAPSLEPT